MSQCSLNRGNFNEILKAIAVQNLILNIRGHTLRKTISESVLKAVYSVLVYECKDCSKKTTFFSCQISL